MTLIFVDFMYINPVLSLEASDLNPKALNKNLLAITQ